MSDRHVATGRLGAWLPYHWGSGSHNPQIVMPLQGPAAARWRDIHIAGPTFGLDNERNPGWALVTGRTPSCTDGLGPLPGPSVAFPGGF